MKLHTIYTVIFLLLIDLASSYDTKCPSGLSGTVEIFNCSCYQFSYPRQNTYNSVVERRLCGNGHLAHILNKETNNFIKSVLRRIAAQPGVDIDYGFWLGATDKAQEDVWKWEPGGEKLSFTDWASDEPDSPLGVIKQHCLYMKQDRGWEWANLQCSNYPNIPYICQYKATECVGEGDKETLFAGLTLTELIAVCVGAVIGLVIVILVLCGLSMVLSRAIRRERKRRQEGRSMRYYRGNPTTSIHRESRIPEGAASIATTSQSEETVPLDQGMNLKVKGGDYPTAASIQAEAEADLVVDVATGRQTMKRSNVPTPSRLADEASTKSLKSFNMDASIPVDEDGVSLISNDNNDSWNLDANMTDKSEKLMDKSMDITK